MTVPVQFAATDAGRGRGPRTPLTEAQFERAYRSTASALWAYLFRLTGDPAAADDLVQKTFLRFLRSNPLLESEEHMRNYIFKTATNLALDHFREKKRTLEQMRDSAFGRTPADDRGDLRHDMQRMFSQLTPRERALLWLAHVEEANHEEISTALDVKPKSVRVLLFRARRHLAEILTRHGLGPEVAR